MVFLLLNAKVSIRHILLVNYKLFMHAWNGKSGSCGPCRKIEYHTQMQLKNSSAHTLCCFWTSFYFSLYSFFGSSSYRNCMIKYLHTQSKPFITYENQQPAVKLKILKLNKTQNIQVMHKYDRISETFNCMKIYAKHWTVNGRNHVNSVEFILNRIGFSMTIV